jgi:pimeloyl-ACP methyl ester carboxylesterase
MKMLARHLRNKGGYEVFPVDYASLRSGIDDQARSLARVIQSLEGIEKINLVGHSMGNIVIRRYLAGDQTPSVGWSPDPRIDRVVMIAPPNHGSITATRLSDYSLFKAVFGESGRQLGADWQDLQKRLATPEVEFGIIAGGLGHRMGFDPFLPGDDDGRITVKTTRLDGASDFLVVSALHELIAHDPRVLRYTVRFLADGYFVSPDQKQGIPRASVAEVAPGQVR